MLLFKEHSRYFTEIEVQFISYAGTCENSCKMATVERAFVHLGGKNIFV